MKVFERVPHDWLVRQATKYRYSLPLLRLSIAVYRLGTTIIVDGICTALILAN